MRTRIERNYKCGAFWPLACRVCHFCKYANAHRAAIYRPALAVILFVRNGVSTSWFNKISKVTKRARSVGALVLRTVWYFIVFTAPPHPPPIILSFSIHLFSRLRYCCVTVKFFRHGTKLSNLRRNFLFYNFFLVTRVTMLIAHRTNSQM